MGKDQKEQLDILTKVLSRDNRELLRTFIAAYPNAQLTHEEKEILRAAAEGGEERG